MNKNINIGLQDWIDKYINHLNLLNKSNSTIDSYVKTLRKFIRDEKIEDIDEFIDMDRAWWLNDWVARQKEEDKISIATINKKIKQMSSFYNFLLHEGIVKENPLYHFPLINASTLNSEYKGDKAMSEEEARAILKAIDTDEFNCHTPYINLRNKALVMILISCGLRIDEVSKIQIQDIEFENNKLYVRGKGKKGAISRYTNFNDKVKVLIIELINYNPNRTYLFTNTRYERLFTQGIRSVWYDALKIANVKHYVPHNCRHFLGSQLVSKGVPINKVSQILGHSNQTTSQKFYIKPIDNFNDDLGKIDIFD